MSQRKFFDARPPFEYKDDASDEDEHYCHCECAAGTDPEEFEGIEERWASLDQKDPSDDEERYALWEAGEITKHIQARLNAKKK